MTTLYGIKNCDTVKKARKWLEGQGIDYHFHDLRDKGLQAATVEDWCRQVPWSTLVNKRSTTWKQLDEATKAQLGADTVVEILLAHPTLIKRPVLDSGVTLSVGFSADHYRSLFP